MSHPNAGAAAGSSTGGGLLLYVLSRVGVHGLTAVDGAAIAGGLSTLVLFVGRRGIKGTLNAVWDGARK